MYVSQGLSRGLQNFDRTSAVGEMDPCIFFQRLSFQKETDYGSAWCKTLGAWLEGTGLTPNNHVPGCALDLARCLQYDASRTMPALLGLPDPALLGTSLILPSSAFVGLSALVLASLLPVCLSACSPSERRFAPRHPHSLPATACYCLPACSIPERSTPYSLPAAACLPAVYQDALRPPHLLPATACYCLLLPAVYQNAPRPPRVPRSPPERPSHPPLPPLSPLIKSHNPPNPPRPNGQCCIEVQILEESNGQLGAKTIHRKCRDVSVRPVEFLVFWGRLQLICNNNNNNNKRPLTPKSMPPVGDEHAKLKT